MPRGLKSRIAALASLGVVIVVLMAVSSAAGAGSIVSTVVPGMMKNLTGTPAPGATATPLPTPMSVAPNAAARFGIQIVGHTNAEIANLVKNAGATQTRISLIWYNTESTRTTPPSYSFGASDALLQPLKDAGLDVIIEIRGSPSWAATKQCGAGIDKPGGLDAFGQFVSAAVGHYKGAPFFVNKWEFWNEPDGQDEETQYGVGCWGNDPHPADYAKMLQVAYSAVKSADQNADVLFGGMAHENPPPFRMDFFEKVLEAGKTLNDSAGSYPFFDVANVHYYSSANAYWCSKADNPNCGGPAGYQPSHGWDIFGKTNMIKDTMAKFGVSKPVAVTELGWTSSNLADPVDAAAFAKWQATYVPKVLARGLAANAYTLIWFSLVDNLDYYYGLLDVNMLKRPAYQAFQVAASEFGSATSVRPLSPTEVGLTSGVEGYVFEVGGQQRWVLWMREGDIWLKENVKANILLPDNVASVTDILGQPVSASGIYQLDINPLYVHFR